MFGGVYTPQGFGADGFTTSLPMSAGVNFNSNSTDTIAGTNIGNYRNAVQDFSVSIGTYFASFAPGNSFIRVTNSAPGAGSDIYQLRVNGLLGSAVNGLQATSFLFTLTDPSGTAFSSDALPTAPPSLSSFARLSIPPGIRCGQHQSAGSIDLSRSIAGSRMAVRSGTDRTGGLGSRGLTTRKGSEA